MKVEEGRRVVELKRAPFSLHFYHQAYGDHENYAQIAAFQDSSAFAQAKAGMRKAELPYFASATGMATRGLYNGLFLGTNGHHYCFYKEEEKRLKLLEKEGEWLKLEFPVNYLKYDGQKRKMKDVTLSRLYLVVLIDRDGDEVMDEEELTKLILLFDQD